MANGAASYALANEWDWVLTFGNCFGHSLFHYGE
jgi:hypothetical protein